MKGEVAMSVKETWGLLHSHARGSEKILSIRAAIPKAPHSVLILVFIFDITV